VLLERKLQRLAMVGSSVDHELRKVQCNAVRCFGHTRKERLVLHHSDTTVYPMALVIACPTGGLWPTPDEIVCERTEACGG